MLVKNRGGSALIIALIILILLTIMSTVFIEKLWRFSVASEGIENSNIAYYNALGLIEETLSGPGVGKKTPWNVAESKVTSTNTGKSMTVFTGSNTIPMIGHGNSPYDTDWNIIALGAPVQLVIPENISPPDWSNIKFEFRVSSIAGNSNTGVLNPTVGSGAILWTFASSGASLFASGESQIFRLSDINTTASINNFNGVTNSGSLSTFGNFYSTYLPTNGGSCTNYACTLKLSLLRPIPLTDGRSMSFLEYRITGFGNSVTLPSQYMTLKSQAYSNGFLRTREIQFPQITTNAALDFAVLQ